MREKVIDNPIDRAPLRQIPQMEHFIASEGFRFHLLPPGLIQMRSCNITAVIDVNLNAVEHLWAWCTDRPERYPLPADSLGFIPPEGDFYLEVENNLPGFLVELEPQFWTDGRNDPRYDPLASRLESLTVPFLDYEHHPVAANLGRAGIEVLRQSAEDHEEADALTLEGIALALLALVQARLLLEENVPPVRSNGALGQNKQALVTEYVEAHLDETVLVGDLARLAYMSSSHFTRCFSATMGVSPARYITERRVERAKLLLRDPRLSLAHVAYACGFGGQAHFTRVFRAATGKTPGQYRVLLSH